MKQSLGMPAKKNVIDLDFFRSNKAIQTQSRPFTFYSSDECKNRVPIDLTGLSFELVILLNGCLQFTASTADGTLKIGTGADTNKLYIDVDILAVPVGVYDYEINDPLTGLQYVKGKAILNS